MTAVAATYPANTYYHGLDGAGLFGPTDGLRTNMSLSRGYYTNLAVPSAM